MCCCVFLAAPHCSVLCTAPGGLCGILVLQGWDTAGYEHRDGVQQQAALGRVMLWCPELCTANKQSL